MNKTEELAYWINEREYMRRRKEAPEDHEPLHPPYSKDPAMANVRYCNVHREDDKVTRWIAKNWRNPNAASPNLTLGMVAARMINWPETLFAIGYPDADFKRWANTAKREMRVYQEGGSKVWTSAYTISTCGRAMKKEDYVFDHVLKQVAERDWPTDPPFPSLSKSHRALMEVDGLGSFLAAQVIADLKNTPGHWLEQAPDFWTWSAPGPGSLRGLEAYFGHRVTSSNYQKSIEQCYNETIPHVFPYVGKIHMQDFQNCLCEFSKYMRVKEGDGRVRNKYPRG